MPSEGSSGHHQTIQVGLLAWGFNPPTPCLILQNPLTASAAIMSFLCQWQTHSQEILNIRVMYLFARLFRCPEWAFLRHFQLMVSLMMSLLAPSIVPALDPPPGVTSNFENPPSYLSRYVAATIAGMIATTIALVLRLLVKIRIVKPTGWDDCSSTSSPMFCELGGLCFYRRWYLADTSIIAWVWKRCISLYLRCSWPTFECSRETAISYNCCRPH